MALVLVKGIEWYWRYRAASQGSSLEHINYRGTVEREAWLRDRLGSKAGTRIGTRCTLSEELHRLLGAVVDRGQAFDRPAVGQGIDHEAYRPSVVLPGP